MNESLPLVAIVGRPNVGKSALFNRLTSSRDALVEDLPGTTRDRHYGAFDWRGRHFRVVDTGGYLLEDEEDPFSPLIRAGVERALSEATVVLFVVDAVDGVALGRRGDRRPPPPLRSADPRRGEQGRCHRWCSRRGANCTRSVSVSPSRSRRTTGSVSAT